MSAVVYLHNRSQAEDVRTDGGAEWGFYALNEVLLHNVRPQGSCSEANVELAGTNSRVSGTTISNPLIAGVRISGLQGYADVTVFGGGIGVHVTAADATVNLVCQGSDNAVHFENVNRGQAHVMAKETDQSSIWVEDSEQVTLTGQIVAAGQHGVLIDESDHCRINMTIIGCGTDTDDTFDNINVAGDRNFITGCLLRGQAGLNDTRYGVNIVSGDCNIVAGNDLSDVGDYGNDALEDTGTNTQLFFPADATYGDNFVDCP